MTGLNTPDPLYLVADEGGVAEKFAVLCRAAGLAAEVVQELPDSGRKVVFLSGLDDFDAPDGQANAVALNYRAFEAARVLGANLHQGEGLFVTVQDSGGDFGLTTDLSAGCWSAGLAALAKTAGREWPLAAVKAIDLERAGRSPEALAQALFDELTQGGPEVEVGLKADGTRLRIAMREAPVPASNLRFSPGDVVVVSGGARGVTAQCLIALARQTPLKIVLLGRTALDDEPEALQPYQTEGELKRALLDQHRQAGQKIALPEVNRAVRRILSAREVRANLETLRSLGAEVRYLSVDITEAASVADALDDVRRQWGPVQALIHAAGVLADKHIHAKTDEQFDRVFRTKVQGLANLLTATRDDPLHHLCCFSSVAARMGNAGQVDYAMANEILNKVCQFEQRRRGGQCVVKSINWGPWDGGMVHPGLKAYFDAMGVTLIPLTDGAEMFVREMAQSSSDDVEIVIGGGLDAWSRNEEPDTLNRSWSWWISPAHYSFLASHQIQGQLVVPVMMVLEWFCRCARAAYPGKHIQAVRNFIVLKGIVLDDPDRGDWFTLSCRSEGRDGPLAFTLHDKTGQARYRARLDLADTPPAAPELSALPTDLEPWSWDADTLYAPGRLFHGPAFQVIRRLAGVSPETCLGELSTTGLPEAPAEPWHIDFRILDGGLQLALLWSTKYDDTPSLPTGFEALHLYQPGPYDGTVHCQLIRTGGNDLMVRGNIVFRNDQRQLLAEIQGVTMHYIPAESLSRPSR